METWQFAIKTANGSGWVNVIIHAQDAHSAREQARAMYGESLLPSGICLKGR